jgi:hypothetical protein
VQRDRAQGQRAVGVVDDGQLTGPEPGQQRGRLVEQQPIGRVDRDQLGRLDVRLAPQRGEQARSVDAAPPASQAMEALPAFWPSEHR